MRRALLAVLLTPLATSCGGHPVNSGGFDPGGEAGYSPCAAITSQPLNDAVVRNPGCYRPDRSVDRSWRQRCRDGSYLARITQADLGRDYWMWAMTSSGTWSRSDLGDSVTAFHHARKKCAR
jgi:hypothetical protein